MTVARVVVVTVSDRSARGEREDVTGPRLAAAVAESGHKVTHRSVVSDDEEGLARHLAEFCDGANAPDLLLTAGGTGLGPRDRAPEATAGVVERRTPGIPEAIRAASRPKLPSADLSRGMAGTRGSTLIVNLPGSPGGADDGWRVLAPIASHIAEQLRGSDH